MRFTSQVIMITGAASGIGAAAALQFAKEGARAIIGIDLNKELLNQTMKECLEAGVETLSFEADVRDAEMADQIFLRILARFNRIDVLVCSAGLYSGAPLVEVSLNEWQKILDINLTGTFLYNQRVSPILMNQRGGSIVNISSMAGKISWPASAQYSASKSGVIGLTRSVAMELAPYQVSVNALCPGNTVTAMVKKVAEKVGAREGMTGEQWLQMRANDCPMKRLASPNEMAAIILFLASKESRYITGQAISADGGMVLN